MGKDKIRGQEPSRLIEMVREGSVPHLLSLLKAEELPQMDLDVALHEAAWRGDLQCCQILVAAGADIYSTGPQGETVLAEAVHSGNMDLVKHLIQSGYIVQYAAQSEGPRTAFPSPLHVAISKNNIDMARILLDASVTTEQPAPDGDTALIAACSSGIATEFIPLLIKAKCNVNAKGHGENTALIQCAERGMIEMVKVLIAAKADVNIQNKAGYTALMVACEVGNADVVRYLLQSKKCDLSLFNKDGNSALHLAALNGDIALVNPLVKEGIDVNALEQHGNTPLIVAACVHNEQFACELIDVCGNKLMLNVQGYGKRTALHFACENDLNELAHVLLQDKSVMPDICDELGNTPLIQCAKQNNNDLMAKLLKMECEVNRQGDKGLSPAHWCVLNRNAKGLKMLLDIVCLHTDLLDEDGNTPLLLGAKNQCGLEMLMLLREEADMDIQDKDGCTVLHWLTTNGAHLLILQFLEKGAKVDIPDKKGDTPLIYAIRYCEWQTIKALIQSGADVDHQGFKKKRPIHFLCQGKMTPSASEHVLQALDDLNHAGAELEVADENGNHPISMAAKQCNRDIVIKMMDLVGPNEINILDCDKKSLLYYFAQNGDLEVVLRLLKCGAEPDRDKCQSNALIEATKGGHGPIVQLLLSNGATVDRRDHHRRSALHWAAQMGHTQIMRILFEHGAKPKRRDISGDTPLTLAAFHGHLDALKMLLPISEINHKEKEEGMAALHLAVSKDYSACVAALLKADADINIVDTHLNTALLCAAIHTSGTAVMKLLLECKQDFDIDYQGDKGRSVLHWCVGDPDCVELVLRYKPDLDLLDANGASPLLLAIAHGQPESSKYLIEAGCDVYQMHSDGRCAIHHACIYGDAETVNLLLAENVNPDTLTKDGRSPLLLACIEGHVECVQELLKANCIINKVYFDAVTPFSVAASNSHYEIMEILLNAGAHPDLIGKQKHSPLITSIYNGDLQGVAILIQWGAECDKGAEENKHPLQVAAIKDHLDILKALAAIECNVNLMRQMLLDGAIYYFVEDDDVLRELSVMSKTPRPLTMLCRQQVRKMISIPVMPKISQLPVPQKVKSFLGMGDLMAILETEKERNFNCHDSIPSRSESYGRDFDGSTLTSDAVLSEPNVSEPNVSDTEE